MTTFAQVFNNSHQQIFEGETSKWLTENSDVVMKIQIFLPPRMRFPKSSLPLTVKRKGEPKPYIITRGFYESSEGTRSFKGYL